MLLILLGLTILNGLFAMSEMALVSARKARLQKYIDEGDRSAIEAARLSEDPALFLSTIQVGLTSIAIINGIIGEKALAEPVSQWLQQHLSLPESTVHGLSTFLVVAFVTYLTIVIGELVPKRLGQLNPEGLARIVARPINWLSLISHPVVVFLTASTSFILRLMGVRDTKGPSVTPEEIHALLVEGSESGVIDEQEHQMVRNVFRLDDRKIASLMVPRMDVTWLSVNDPPEVTLDKIATSQYSRFPVCRDSINDVMGLVMAKTVLTQALTGQTIDLEAIMQPPLYVPESLNGMELLNALRGSPTEMALVVDEYGDIQGIVTITDIMDAVLGRLQAGEGEGDEALVVEREDGSLLVDGGLHIDELRELTGERLADAEEHDYHTAAGLVIAHFGRIPHVGEHFRIGLWRVEVVDLDGPRIDKLLLQRSPDAMDGDDGTG